LTASHDTASHSIEPDVLDADLTPADIAFALHMPPVTSWFAVLTTGGTPAGAISRLNMEIAKILRDPKVQERLASQTFEIKGGSPEELAKRMREDAATNAKVVAEARITAE
jgi:tripartite-type tricarboxylate transporter receptor subunit TctC